jgi:hypothetical protein
MHAKRIALVALLPLAFPAVAAADQYAPTAAELAQARSVAVAYWHVQQPPCGRETVLLEPLPSGMGRAGFDQCTITFSAAADWRDFPAGTCRIYVHEYGHLVLGPTYFFASNPADPAHSADPANIMYGSVPTPQQEDEQERGIGCLPPLATGRHQSRHHRRRHHPRG